MSFTRRTNFIRLPRANKREGDFNQALVRMCASPSRFVGSMLVDGGVGFAARAGCERGPDEWIGISGQETDGAVKHDELDAARVVAAEAAVTIRRVILVRVVVQVWHGGRHMPPGKCPVASCPGLVAPHGRADIGAIFPLPLLM